MGQAGITGFGLGRAGLVEVPSMRHREARSGTTPASSLYLRNYPCHLEFELD
jgi:hypothetical protein